MYEVKISLNGTDLISVFIECLYKHNTSIQDSFDKILRTIKFLNFLPDDKVLASSKWKSISQTTIKDSSKPKDFADETFKFDENARK